MAAAQQSGGGQGDNSSAMLWWVAILFATLGGLWYGLQPQIVRFYLVSKWYELQFLYTLSAYFPINQAEILTLQSQIEAALNNVKAVSFQYLITVGREVGVWIRIPFTLIMFVLAVLVYITNTTRTFKQAYNMRQFMKLESQNWPQITPVLDIDLLKEDIDVGPWSMAMTPMQFCKRFKLLEEVRTSSSAEMQFGSGVKVEVVLKRGEANQKFAMQLGPLWKGSRYLPPYAKAIYAACIARINADSKPAEAIFKQLAMSQPGKWNLSGVDALIKKHEDTKLVKQILARHAYMLTIMASVLEAAREDGVQASADFLWLKPVDRRLWYTLNVVGRQTPFVEVAGIFAHWIAEKRAGRRLLVPMVEEATNALELALKEIVYKPDEE